MSTHPPMGLYLSSFCGYCFRVKRALDALPVSPAQVQVHDVTRAPQLRQDILGATGRTTVPVLRVPKTDEGQSQPGLDRLSGFWRGPGADDDWLFESRDIITFLDERYGPSPRTGKS